MIQKIWLLYVPIFVCSLFGLSACGSKPILEAKGAATPVGVDLSGKWLLRENRGTDGSRSVSGSTEPPLVIPGLTRQRQIRRRNSSGTSVQVFLENGEALKITQTGFGIFISYDRSVVEEYRFGENRRISIGPIEATRVSGWDGAAFVVETLDSSGTVLYEAWHLKGDGAVLVRDIRISRNEKNSFAKQQIFDRTGIASKTGGDSLGSPAGS